MLHWFRCCLLWNGKNQVQKPLLLNPGKQLLKMTTERQREGRAITNIHQNRSRDEAIHSRGREEKYHQYLTLFYGEATWFRPGSCAGDQRQSITIDKICVQGRPSHFVSLCSACVKLPPQRSQTKPWVSAPSSPWLLAIIIASLPLKREYLAKCVVCWWDPKWREAHDWKKKH